MASTRSEADMIQSLRTELSSYILEILCFAAYTCVFVHTFSVITSLPDGFNLRRWPCVMLITFMWMAALVCAALSWYQIDFIYIVHGTTRADMFNIYTTLDGIFFTLVVSRTLRAANVFLAECVMVWRCWVICARSWLTVIPFLCIIVEIVAFTLWMINVCDVEQDSIAGPSIVDWRVVYNSLVVLGNVVCTGLIIARIVNMTGVKESRTYRGIIEILVESCFLYSAVYLVFLIMYINAVYDVNWNTTYYYPYAMLSSITGIAPALIILRVALGQARPSDSWKGSLKITGPNLTISPAATSPVHTESFEIDDQPSELLPEESSYRSFSLSSQYGDEREKAPEGSDSDEDRRRQM